MSDECCAVPAISQQEALMLTRERMICAGMEAFRSIATATQAVQQVVTDRILVEAILDAALRIRPLGGDPQ